MDERTQMLWHFAGQALAGFLANPSLVRAVDVSVVDRDIVVRAAWSYAFAMVELYESNSN